MEECFSYYQKLITGLPEPYLHFKDNENCFADIVINFKPLYYTMVTKYGFIGQEAIFNVYIDCILDCLKRFDPEKGKQTFGNYLKTAFMQGCITEITRNNCDKRKANIGTYNIDDIFDENEIADSKRDEDKLNAIIAVCEEEYSSGLRK